MTRPQITLRIGAAHDEVVIDGHTFDRSGLDRGQRRTMSELIIEALFGKQRPFKPRRPRQPRRKPRG
jgi:hypothetical protein